LIEPKLVVDEMPDPIFREAILRPLLNYNSGKVGTTTLEPLAILLRHPETDEIIGGLWGSSAYDWLFIDLLYVPDELRMRGVGSSLMKRAEEVAAKRGCVGIWVDTYTFQAPGFYEKVGYKTYGKLTDHPKGHERICYFKKLVQQ